MVQNWIKRRGSKKSKVNYLVYEVVLTKKKKNKKVVKRDGVIIQINRRALVKKNSYKNNQEDLSDDYLEQNSVVNNTNSKLIYKIMFSDRTTTWLAGADIHKHLKNKKFIFDDGKVFDNTANSLKTNNTSNIQLQLPLQIKQKKNLLNQPLKKLLNLLQLLVKNLKKII